MPVPCASSLTSLSPGGRGLEHIRRASQLDGRFFCIPSRLRPGGRAQPIGTGLGLTPYLQALPSAVDVSDTRRSTRFSPTAQQPSPRVSRVCARGGGWSDTTRPAAPDSFAVKFLARPSPTARVKRVEWRGDVEKRERKKDRTYTEKGERWGREAEPDCRRSSQAYLQQGDRCLSFIRDVKVSLRLVWAAGVDPSRRATKTILPPYCPDTIIKRPPGSDHGFTTLLARRCLLLRSLAFGNHLFVCLLQVTFSYKAQM
ncbi:hypothetical protein ElyMa_002457200 [Elysia marginata]|uniref:Uncharacterized protein n=1 Tax=Elysia marginata TaxID=1093978 RepID=A0AAV4GLZ6_9GAST|nr:hypothetical protein ElyMa_002457200 [Elysia marginata]